MSHTPTDSMSMHVLLKHRASIPDFQFLTDVLFLFLELTDYSSLLSLLCSSFSVFPFFVSTLSLGIFSQCVFLQTTLCCVSVCFSSVTHSCSVFLREGCMGRGRPLCPSWIHTMVRLHILSHCMSEHGVFVPTAAPPDLQQPHVALV